MVLESQWIFNVREMLLLLKINNFIRAIDRKIGNGINNIELMVIKLVILVKILYRRINKIWEKQQKLSRNFKD